MKITRKPSLGLLAGVAVVAAAVSQASATMPARAIVIQSSSVLAVQWIRACYFTQSSTGGFTIEQCFRFMPRRFYDVPLRRRSP